MMMRFNIWMGFIIPWILGIGLLKKQKELVRIVPFVWVLSTLVNVWGDYYKFWIVKPKRKSKQYLTTMPYNLGLYPMLSMFMVYWIKNNRKSLPLIFLFSLFTTVAEYGMVLLKKVTYGENWSCLKTFFSYLLPYYLVYRYYLWTHSSK